MYKRMTVANDSSFASEKQFLSSLLLSDYCVQDNTIILWRLFESVIVDPSFHSDHEINRPVKITSNLKMSLKNRTEKYQNFAELQIRAIRQAYYTKLSERFFWIPPD